MKRRKHARVYHGRHKGSTDTHIPNDKMRENYDSMLWESMVYFTCPTCGLISKVHKLEIKVFRCPCEVGGG